MTKSKKMQFQANFLHFLCFQKDLKSITMKLSSNSISYNTILTVMIAVFIVCFMISCCQSLIETTTFRSLTSGLHLAYFTDFPLN